jgi:hypothetical protein
MKIMQKFKDYQPTKAALVWAAAGAVVATVAVGFTAGGWVTGGTAQQMANQAAANAHAQLAAAVCVERFRGMETARDKHRQLVSVSGFRQRQLVENAEWAVLPGGEALGRQAATLCAEQIAVLDPEELPHPVAELTEEPA